MSNISQRLATLFSSSLPTLIAAVSVRAKTRFLEFFASNILNPHTRRACVNIPTQTHSVTIMPVVNDGFWKWRNVAIDPILPLAYISELCLQ